MLTEGERAPTVASSPSSTAAWEAYRDLPVSRADSKRWQQGSHTHTGIFRTPAGGCSVSRRFSEPSRIGSCITLHNVAGASWAWGRRRGAVGLQKGCAVLLSSTPSLPAPQQQPGTTTSACSFSQRQLSGGSQLVLLSCS